MSTNKDGLAKNLEVVKFELYLWRLQMKEGVARFKQGSLKVGDKNNYFHLVVNLIEETYDCLPRTLTYLTITALPLTLVVTAL